MTVADPLARRAAILAGLVCGNPARGWPDLQRGIAGEPELARATLLWLIHPERQAWVSELSPTELAGLYCFMWNNFPRDERPYGSRVPPERQAIQFRSRIPEWIADMGTEEAVRALDDLAERFPEQRERWALHRREARRRLRENTHQPAKPAELLSLERDAGTRLVRGDRDLMGLVLESLQRLDDRLQGRSGGTPLARALWNERGKGADWRGCPKDENFLSDYVKEHLDIDLVQRGILANREVELRAAGSGDGQRTDILVQAVAKRCPGEEGEPIATVVIEVKGCWNPGLEMAMEDQLRDRYLRDNGYRCGIYLVGWFVCDRWQGAQVAKRKARPEDTIEAWRDRLTKQAEELSLDGFRLCAFVLDVRV